MQDHPQAPARGGVAQSGTDAPSATTVSIRHRFRRVLLAVKNGRNGTTLRLLPLFLELYTEVNAENWHPGAERTAARDGR